MYQILSIYCVANDIGTAVYVTTVIARQWCTVTILPIFLERGDVIRVSPPISNSPAFPHIWDTYMSKHKEYMSNWPYRRNICCKCPRTQPPPCDPGCASFPIFANFLASPR